MGRIPCGAIHALRVERDTGRVSGDSGTADYTYRGRENVVMLLLNQQNVQLFDPHFRMGIITADPDDNKFVDCAFAAGADYLVSEDSHFRILHDTPFPKLNLVTLDEFMQTRLVKEQ